MALSLLAEDWLFMIIMHSRVTHKYYKLTYLIQLQNIERENCDDEALICQIYQNFPCQTFVPYGIS